MIRRMPKIHCTCIPFGECRAKTCPDGSPGTFVFDHCRYAGYVAEGLMSFLPERARCFLPSETAFLVSLHDIGKVSPGFQGKYFMPLLQKAAPEVATGVMNGGYVTNHASIGAKALLKLFGLTPDDLVVRTVASHHGYSPERLDFTQDGPWQTEREKLVNALGSEFGANLDAVARTKIPVDLLMGITCVADWISSDESFFPPAEPSLSSDEGRSRAAEALSACGFTRTSFRHGLSFHDIFGFDPYPAQQKFLETVSSPGVYVLEAPMGMGKTESALYAVYKLIEHGFHSGIYFALPTRLTSDRIHERVNSFLQKVSIHPSAVKLAHGQAWLKEFEKGAEGTGCDSVACPPPWFNPSKRGLLFPFAVGTIDQALMAVINVKHSFVRSFALAGKVVILDEVHSYDAYTGTLLDELVAHLRKQGCTVIILSATLTTARRKSLIGSHAPEGDSYPLLTGIQEDTGMSIVCNLAVPSSRDFRLRWIDASAQAPIDIALEKARSGCNVLCIANTVPTAQDWFRAIKTELCEGDDFPIGLLHSKFTGADRERIEQEWMTRLGKTTKENQGSRPHGSILVATQIVEQSVDIDADWMLSEIAPVDMLLQRLGRLWRHDRPERPVDVPELAVVCEKMPSPSYSELSADTKTLESFFGRGVWVYAPYVLLRTYEILHRRETISIPDGIRSLLESVYSEIVPNTQLHRDLYASLTEKAERLRRLARMGQADSLPTRDDDEDRAGTRYNSRPSISLLVLQSCERSASGFMATLLDGSHVSISPFFRDFGVTKALYRNLVQVTPNTELQDARSDSEMLGRYFFASDMPRICIWDAGSGVLHRFGSQEDTGYAYHSRFGVYRVQRDESEESDSEHAKGMASIVDSTNLENSSIMADPCGEFIFENGNDW